jgi:hypothetical protein
VNAELWATLGTAVATLLLLVVPSVAYAYSVLEIWIDDEHSYPDVASRSDAMRR